MKEKDKLDRMVKTAQRIFCDELKDKIITIERLLGTNMDELTDSDLEQIKRFFHSIHGTASTLGLNAMSLIGEEWEQQLRIINEQGHKQNAAFKKDLLVVINQLKEQIVHLDKEREDCEPYEELEYTNMPDRGKILLVDDDITILKLLESALTLEGYRVYICDNSTTAMDMMASVRPDIIILDIVMPNLSGYEILEEIKNKPEYADIHIIILSARGDTDDKIQGLRSGADDYITKPFVIGEVTTRIEIMMRRSANYKEKLLKDCLTGAFSRYYFNLRISEEFERYRRSHTVFSIAFIDMDHYKYINDQHGHQIGDYALKKFVSYMENHIRSCDSIYRYGGEEFIILLPDTTDKQAYEVIERVRRGFNNNICSVDGVDLNISFSAGIKQITQNDESAEQLIRSADKAMYHAKRHGRNRVMVYNEEIEGQSLMKTLLIVDDENTILSLLQDRFSDMGYHVVTAKDGKTALALVKEVRPDAILLDLMLPDTNGFEVCKSIKRNDKSHSSKVVMVSKKSEKASVVKGLECGADDYVTKPFSMEELEARVLKVLNVN